MGDNIVFRNYWWLALVFGGVAAGLAFAFGGEQRGGLVGAAIAGALGFCYFVQQQKLAETQLFHNLFTAFNRRYDDLNGRLSDIASRQSPTSDDDRKLVVDYFNLCGEEYLFFRQGYIHRDVWRSWCRGMLWYLRRHPFREIWYDEVKTDSLYGLSFEVIERGAL